MDIGKFEMLIIVFAVLMFVGYLSLCSERLVHAVYAVYVTHGILREGILLVVLFTQSFILGWLRVLRLGFVFLLSFFLFLPASSTL